MALFQVTATAARSSSVVALIISMLTQFRDLKRKHTHTRKSDKQGFFPSGVMAPQCVNKFHGLLSGQMFDASYTFWLNWAQRNLLRMNHLWRNLLCGTLFWINGLFGVFLLLRTEEPLIYGSLPRPCLEAKWHTPSVRTRRAAAASDSWH